MPANFGGHCVIQGFDALQVSVQQRVTALRATGVAADKLASERILDAYVKLRRELDALSLRTASRGTRILRDHERQSRVRPDSGGEGGHRLEDSLFCEPVKEFGVHGAVGIANYDILDAEVPWWWTQEVGYAGNVGRLVFGAFFHPGGDTRPSPSLDKQHAIFEPRGDATSRAESGEGGKRGSMVIGKEIAAKHFLESGARVIEAEWQAAFDTILADYVTEVAAIP